MSNNKVSFDFCLWWGICYFLYNFILIPTYYSDSMYSATDKDKRKTFVFYII